MGSLPWPANYVLTACIPVQGEASRKVAAAATGNVLQSSGWCCHPLHLDAVLKWTRKQEDFLHSKGCNGGVHQY